MEYFLDFLNQLYRFRRVYPQVFIYSNFRNSRSRGNVEEPRLKFLLDHTTAIYLQKIREAGYEADTCDHQTNLGNASPDSVLMYAADQMQTVITCNKEYMRVDSDKNRFGTLILPSAFMLEKKESMLGELLMRVNDMDKLRLYPIQTYVAQKLHDDEWQVRVAVADDYKTCLKH
ncbi:hypothetical protein BC937DRAFT_89168 [Endogone sp. FLAS-F59071]|nr:hypothetical protein BC937DRAFT_89168 [Endogone sp. FLAS-F59071]|eukprot:RUS18078.1 hypothetical protein BC937DRAFT_89168 [Endogone sp. FLAS-F59071]